MYYLSRADVAVLLSCLLLTSAGLTGCGPGESATERARRDADPQALTSLRQAENALHRGALDQAMSSIEAARMYAPELADVYYLRAKILTELKHFHEVEISYRKVLELDPEYEGVYMHMGNIALLKGEYRQAASYFEQEDGRGAEALLLMSKAYAYQRMGDTDRALRLYEDAIAADSARSTGYIRMGNLLRDEGKFREALSYYRQGLNVEPGNIDHQYSLGSVLMLMGQLDEAIEVLRVVAAERPAHYGAVSSLGRALIQSGEIEEGAWFLTRADSLQEVMVEIGHLQTLTESYPERADHWIELSRAFTGIGELEEAVNALTIALFLAPDSSILQNDLAQLYMMKGDTARAVAQYHSMIRR